MEPIKTEIDYTDNIVPIYDPKLLSDLRNLIKSADLASTEFEREIVSLAYRTLGGQVIVSKLTEAERYGVACCLVLWGMSDSTIAKVMGRV